MICEYIRRKCKCIYFFNVKGISIGTAQSTWPCLAASFFIKLGNGHILRI